LIIVLNGASSSGKTSLARALQLQWPGPLLHLGTDSMIQMLPAPYSGMKPSAREGIQFYNDVDERGPVVHVRAGSVWRKLETSFARAVRVLAEDAHDLVLDLVLFEPASLAPYVRELHEQRTYFIGVRCILPVLEARELAREDRFQNLARAQHEAVHEPPRCYDLEVDTTSSGPHELARSILQFVDANPRPNAFSLLHSELFAAKGPA